MLTKEKMDRINELANKSKVVALTDEEKAEQKVLRDEYLLKFRSNFKRQLDNIDITFVDEIDESKH